MWCVTEMANVLKSYAVQNSYENFKNRRIAAALCSDLLASFEECHIITMLFREGLGECMHNAPYTTAYDKSLAKNRVKAFVRKLGFDDTVVDNVANFVEILTDATTTSAQTSILEILNRQREQAKTYELERQKNVSVEKESDFDYMICSDVEVLSIRSSYQGKTVPSLKPFVKLKEFSNFFPLPWSKVSEINMQNLDKLYFCNADSDSDIQITAPMLEKLSICGRDNDYEELTPLERMLREASPRLEINANRLKRLEISRMSGYNFSSIGSLENLDCLIIRNTELTDMSWLKGCKNLRKLHIYSEVQDIGDIPEIESLQELYLDYAGIECLESIKLFPNLRVLCLRGNKVQTITKTDNLQHIRRIDLSRNPIADTGKMGGLENPELILSDVDRELYSFDKKIEDVFRRAYLSYASREKNFESLSPYMKRYWMMKSDEEKYADLVNDIFEDSFYSCNPASFTIEYDTRIKRQYLEFVKDQFPFIEIKEEFEKQIQREYFGAVHFHKEKPGNVLYVNQSLYIIRVKLENGSGGVDVNFINTGSQKLNSSVIEKLIKDNCPYIDLSYTKVMIAVFDLYRTRFLEGLEVGILAALYSMEHKITLPASTFVAGGYKQKGLFKKLKTTSRMNQIAKLQGANRIVFFTSGRQEQIEIAGVRVEYCNVMTALQ